MNTLQVMEFIAVVSGIIHVFLLTREKIIAWPFGILTVSLYIYIFAESKLYSDVILHVVYVVLNIFGWWNWARRGAGTIHVPITRLSKQEIGAWAGLILVGFVAWGYVMGANTDASYPYGDAFTTVASLIAQFLLARKKIENWLIWIIVDVVAIAIYALKGLYLTTGLYAVYLLLSTKGFLDWRRTMRTAQG
ncbi:MAG: nicotinamide mononucleotide transporter [Phaeodactylibacter sp.]|nr:nicotinamide mononucleotide transporter [Phaeodactylibacter sp.]MCB9273020.1 nicotinamide mononucleotide transporter [Lewinellaceae bacterium]